MSSPSIAPRPQTLANVVNPFGTVTTVVETPYDTQSSEAYKFYQEYSSGAYLHENSDESRFRPYVAVLDSGLDEFIKEYDNQPEPVNRQLIVPVIEAAAISAERAHRAAARQREQVDRQVAANTAKMEQMSLSIASANNQEGGKKESAKKPPTTTTSANVSVEKKVVNKNDENSSKKAKAESTASDTKSGTGNKENDKVDADKSKGKKKATKNVVAKPMETPVECEALKAKAQTFDQPNENSKPLKIEDLIEDVDRMKPSSRDANASNEFVAPNGKVKKITIIDSTASSKESSVERELPPVAAAGTANTTAPPPPSSSSAWKKKKKGKKSIEAAAAPSATVESKSDTNSDSQVDNLIQSIPMYNVCTDDFSILDAIGHVDRMQCAEIQGSLMKTSDASAIVMQRKVSLQENVDSSEADEPKASSSSTSPPLESDEPNNLSTGEADDSFEMEPLVASMQFTSSGEAIPLDHRVDALIFDPSDGDSSLSFKSTTDEQTGGGQLDDNVAERSAISVNSDEFEQVAADRSIVSANSDDFEKLASDRSVTSPNSDDFDKCAADKSAASANSDDYEKVAGDRSAVDDEFEKVDDTNDADERSVDSKFLKIVDVMMLGRSLTSSSSSSSNSSSETEDSGRGGKSTTNSDDKTGDEDSDTVKVATDSDTNALASDVNEDADANANTDALPDENQSMAAEEATVPKAQPPPQKQQGNNNYNKKKSRKKRR